MSFESYLTQVHEYFPFCPMCGSTELKANITSGRDALACKECGARWHLYFSRLSDNLKWAKLEVAADDGTGNELIGKQLEKDHWQKLARQARKRTVAQNLPQPVVVKEKETIIKEVVMIPCTYCGGFMPQTSVFCPNCGARRTA